MRPMETFVEFSFEAAHTTPPYPHPHGHSFRAQVVLTGTPVPVYAGPTTSRRWSPSSTPCGTSWTTST
jgi:hypothetical protein